MVSSLLRVGHRVMSPLASRRQLFYSKTCLKRTLKTDKTKILMTDGSLIKSKALQNAPWSILQYF